MIKSNHLKLNNFIFLFTLFLGLAWLAAEGGETKKVSNANINLDPNFKISQALVISGYPIQGNLIIAKTDPSNKVQLNDDRIEIDEREYVIAAAKIVLKKYYDDPFLPDIFPISAILLFIKEITFIII